MDLSTQRQHDLEINKNACETYMRTYRGERQWVLFVNGTLRQTAKYKKDLLLPEYDNFYLCCTVEYEIKIR